MPRIFDDWPPEALRLLSPRTSSFWVENGDALRISVFSNVATATLVAAGRLLTADGEYHTFSQTLTISASGAQTAVEMPVGQGWVVDFDLSCSTASIPVGAIGASVEIIQGAGSTATPVSVLAAGGVATYHPLGLGNDNGGG
jgi:ABC-type phosphate transport system substrate-binding protein